MVKVHSVRYTTRLRTLLTVIPAIASGSHRLKEYAGSRNHGGKTIIPHDTDNWILAHSIECAVGAALRRSLAIRTL